MAVAKLALLKILGIGSAVLLLTKKSAAGPGNNSPNPPLPNVNPVPVDNPTTPEGKYQGLLNAYFGTSGRIHGLFAHIITDSWDNVYTWLYSDFEGWRTYYYPNVNVPSTKVDRYNIMLHYFGIWWGQKATKKLFFLDRVSDLFAYYTGAGSYAGQPLGDLSYVRTSSMYSDIFGKRAQMRVHSGPYADQTLREGFNGDVVERGTFAAMANWIKWQLTVNVGWDGSSYGLSGEEATQVIEDYVTAIGQQNTLGRGGPTCSYACSVLGSINVVAVINAIIKFLGEAFKSSAPHSGDPTDNTSSPDDPNNPDSPDQVYDDSTAP